MQADIVLQRAFVGRTRRRPWNGVLGWQPTEICTETWSQCHAPPNGLRTLRQGTKPPPDSHLALPLAPVAVGAGADGSKPLDASYSSQEALLPQLNRLAPVAGIQRPGSKL